ncbi:MAG: hypothetical protein WCF75_19150, partial [Pseudolabrys sp.]
KKAGQAGRKEANTAESCGGARPCSDDGRTGPYAIIALADKSAGCSSITSARPLPGAGRKNARGFWTLWPISARIPISWVASQGPAAQAMDGNSGTSRFNN